MGLFTKGASEYRKGLKAENAKDYKTAVRLYEKSAEAGYPLGCYRLAICYANGTGVATDYEKALSLAKEAELYDIDCDIDEGLIEFISQMEKKVAEKKKADEAAAKKATAEAKVHEEEQKQDELILKSMDEFPLEKYTPEEMFRMAFKFYESQEYEKALGIFLRYAVVGVAQAQYICGLMYRDGEGVEVSKERAFFWMEKAAENGSPEAQYDIAFMCSNIKDGLSWLTKAYNQAENPDIKKKAEEKLRGFGIPIENL
ncbi:MAG: sel1 repeat family protein [Ruminococcus sp.]|nr:sel1 repeat family protein [Ruminococcus sp.]